MTDVALRDHLEAMIREMDRRYEQRFLASEHAVMKSENSMNVRLTSMNEFRDALNDQAGRMATRAELERVDQEVQDLRRAKANLDGRLLALAGGLSALTSVAVWILTWREDNRDRQRG